CHTDEVVQSVARSMAGGYGRRLDLATRALGRAAELADPEAPLVEPRGQGHAAPDGEPLAQGARGRLDARRGAVHRVPLESAVDATQRPQLLMREVTGLGQRRVQDRDAVALGQDEPVPVDRRSGV